VRLPPASSIGTYASRLDILGEMISASVHIEKLSERAWRLSPLTEGETLGLVVVQHGLRSRKERHLELALRLTNTGYTVLLTEAAFHGERKGGDISAILHSGPAHPEFYSAAAACVRATVSEIQSLVEESNYRYIGHSLGGLIGLHLAHTDHRISHLVIISGAIDTEAALGPSGASLSPLRWAAELSHPRITLLHGTDDLTVPFSWAESLLKLLPAGAVLHPYPDTGHTLTEPMMLDAIPRVQERNLRTRRAIHTPDSAR